MSNPATDIPSLGAYAVDQTRRERGWLDPTQAGELCATLALRTGQLEAARRHADDYQAEAAWLRKILEDEGYDTAAMYAARELASPGTPKTPTLAAGAQGAGESGVGSRFNSGPPAPLDYLLWSNKRQAWWRPGACGYTTIQAEAGRYSEEEAVRRVLRSAQCGRVEEVTLMVVAPPLCPPGEHLWGRAVGLQPARRVRCQRCGETTSVPVTRVDP